MLKANNITQVFAGGAGIKDITVTIKPGELTALIGPSGSGKTTFLKALAMLDLPQSGTITFDDHHYSFPLAEGEELAPRPWPKITAAFQQLFLWPHMTLRENIMLPVGNSPAKIKELDELIELFDMAHFIDRYPNETSGGQKQRAAIARAVLLDPKYILLDEITSALDVEQTVKVLRCLEALKEKNIGILLITHLINFAGQSADKIIFIDEGKILEQGDVSLLKNPKTARMKTFLGQIAIAS